MRISSQNNQFIFNLPQDIISRKLEEQFQLLMDKNHMAYNDVVDFINSTIKDIVFPSVSYGVAEQKKYHGKNVSWRESGNVMDKYQGELDITFRSVDSHLNYFILMQILNDFYLKEKNYLDYFDIKILDKDGDLIYTVLLTEVIFKSLSELRMAYYATEFNEQTFTLQIKYNYIDIIWELNDIKETYGKSIFDVDVIEPNPKDYSKIEQFSKDRIKNSDK